ncbi:MAG: aldo/keto reductase [Acidobacteriota bacterium]
MSEIDFNGTNLVDGSRRRLGRSAFECGPLAFGCWRFVGMTVEEGQRRIEAALDHGLDLIDTADVYGLDWGGTAFGQAEELLGAVLRQAPSLRERMVLATKGGIQPGVPYDSSTQYLRSAVEASLQRLATDTIDLYQIHRPDPFTHPAELAETLDVLRREGKIREVGVSNYTVPQLEALAEVLPFDLATSQPELSALALAPIFGGELDVLQQREIRPLAWSPLGGGRLATGDGVREELISVLDELAERESVARTDVALAFVLAHPSKPVAILGTQTIERIETAHACCSVRLDRSDVYRIVEASTGESLP